MGKKTSKACEICNAVINLKIEEMQAVNFIEPYILGTKSGTTFRRATTLLQVPSRHPNSSLVRGVNATSS
jgi:hypothetical protein